MPSISWWRFWNRRHFATIGLHSALKQRLADMTRIDQKVAKSTRYTFRVTLVSAAQKGRALFMRQKLVKQWVFFGCGLIASLLAILGLGFRILLPYFVLLAAALYVVVVIVGINLLFNRQRR